MSDQNKSTSTPAKRAGEIPGIIWESWFNGMLHHTHAARTEIDLNHNNALAHIADLEEKLLALKSFIIDGVRDHSK